MKIEHEIKKVADLLLLPVDNLKFNHSAEYVTVYISNEPIGNLPYYTAANILLYDTSIPVVNKLNWHKIVSDNHKLFHSKAVELNSDISKLTIGTFRKMYAYDISENLICSLEFRHESSQWIAVKDN